MAALHFAFVVLFISSAKLLEKYYTLNRTTKSRGYYFYIARMYVHGNVCIPEIFFFLFDLFLGPGQGVCRFCNTAKPGAPQVSQEGI